MMLKTRFLKTICLKPKSSISRNSPKTFHMNLYYMKQKNNWKFLLTNSLSLLLNGLRVIFFSNTKIEQCLDHLSKTRRVHFLKKSSNKKIGFKSFLELFCSLSQKRNVSVQLSMIFEGFGYLVRIVERLRLKSSGK